MFYSYTGRNHQKNIFPIGCRKINSSNSCKNTLSSIFIAIERHGLWKSYSRKESIEKWTSVQINKTMGTPMSV
jgi:hypothetical protein